MSLISQSFGFDGANNSQKQSEAQGRRNSGVAGDYAGLFGTASGQYADWQHVLGSMHLDGSLGTALNQINRDPGQLVQQYGAGANEHAAEASRQYGNYLKSQGYGDGATNGAAQGFYDSAARQTNAYAAQQYSPEARAQAVQQLLASVSAGSQVFGGQLGTLAQGVYGAPTVQVQPNPLSSILGQAAGLASTYYTGGLNKAAGASGSGAGASIFGGGSSAGYNPYAPASGLPTTYSPWMG